VLLVQCPFHPSKKIFFLGIFVGHTFDLAGFVIASSWPVLQVYCAHQYIVNCSPPCTPHERSRGRQNSCITVLECPVISDYGRAEANLLHLQEALAFWEILRCAILCGSRLCSILMDSILPGGCAKECILSLSSCSPWWMQIIARGRPISPHMSLDM